MWPCHGLPGGLAVTGADFAARRPAGAADPLRANGRLNTAYPLKESFGQLWNYQKKEGWARRCFESWGAALKGQRLGPYEEFAAMIERHWDGLAAFCQSENKVALGFVEGVISKVRVLQRPAYGLPDEESPRLKVPTQILPEP